MIDSAAELAHGLGMLIDILIALLFIGFALWLVTKLPLDPLITTVIRGVVIFVVILWFLEGFGRFHGWHTGLPHYRH